MIKQKNNFKKRKSNVNRKSKNNRIQLGPKPIHFYVILFILVFGSVGIALTFFTHAATNPKPIWAVSTGNIIRFQQYGASDTLLRTAFGNSSDYIISFGSEPSQPTESGISDIETRPYDNYADVNGTEGLSSALNDGNLPGPVTSWGGQYKSGVYDNERWAQTPLNEQSNPAYYMRLAAEALHAKGLQAINAPGVSLVYSSGSLINNNPYTTYLWRGIAENAAMYADVYVIQAEGTETNLSQYENFVTKAAQQAYNANHGVKILVDLSSQVNGQAPSITQLKSAYWYVRNNVPLVKGFWISNPDPTNTDLWINLLKTEYGNI
jgi:hypothetical protein